MPRKILFVDDEQNLLQGLKRMLRGMRNIWDMDFAINGQDALKIMTQKPFDVIVTDMRMPIMNGNMLLSQVKERYPHMVRIILSGHADKEMILQSTKVAHQFLSKPSDAESIKTAIHRSLALHDLLIDDAIKRIISSIDCLPSLPSLYTKVIEELESNNTSMNKVGQIISEDLAMTAKMLQLVNSAFFGNFQNITSPEKAAIVLGMDTVKALVLSLGVFSIFDATHISERTMMKLWNHSKTVGAFARLIAKGENCDQKMIDNALMAGMLHDMGRLLLATNLSEQYENIRELCRDKGISIIDGELEIFGTTHAEVGAYLLNIWGFSDTIVEAIAYHHFPERCPLKKFTPLTAVHVANSLECVNHHRDPEESVTVNKTYISELGLTEKMVKWQNICEELVENDNEKLG